MTNTSRLRAIVQFAALLASMVSTPGAFAQAGSIVLPSSAYVIAGTRRLPPEEAQRAAIADEVKRAFESGNFSELEADYEAAIRESRRTSSGLFVADHMVRQLGAALREPYEIRQGDKKTAARLIDEHWSRFEDRARAWGKASPRSSAPAVFLSAVLVEHGFAFRGWGWISTVSPEDRARFVHLVEAAYRALIARRDIGINDPAWHAQLVQLGRLQSWRPAGRYDDAVRSAIQRFPGYYSIYFDLAQSATPSWGGSVDAVEAVADMAARQSRSSDGEGLYARVYWAVGEQLIAAGHGLARADWSRMKQGFEDIIARYPDEWNRNTYARFACEAGDKPALGRALALVGDDFNYGVWGGPAAIDFCRKMAK